MTAGARWSDKAFKQAMIVSSAGHVILFAFIILNPALPQKASPRGVIHYISMGMIGGGGGGRPAGGGEKTEPGTTAAKQDSLRDLTVPEKVIPKNESKLRYPVDDKAKLRKKKRPFPGPGRGARRGPREGPASGKAVPA